MAVETTLAAYEESPAAWGPRKRLLRAVQRANIEIHDQAFTVPELARMATTLTAVSIDNGILNAAHVGDCRLYLLREGRVTQLSKDHTVVGRRTGSDFSARSKRANTPNAAHSRAASVPT